MSAKPRTVPDTTTAPWDATADDASEDFNACPCPVFQANALTFRYRLQELMLESDNFLDGSIPKFFEDSDGTLVSTFDRMLKICAELQRDLRSMKKTARNPKVVEYLHRTDSQTLWEEVGTTAPRHRVKFKNSPTLRRGQLVDIAPVDPTCVRAFSGGVGATTDVESIEPTERMVPAGLVPAKAPKKKARNKRR